MTSVFHSSKSEEWGTPPEIIEAARRVLGRIDLDPASSDKWNRMVKAHDYFDGELQDGLEERWHGSVWLNAPGGKFPKGHALGGQSKAGLFWAKLLYEINEGNVKHAVVMAFTMNQLQSTQNCALGAMPEFPFCIPTARVKYRNPAGGADAPPHASAIVYVPGTVDRHVDFRREFSVFGCICNGGI